jgi:hypothetical protein
VCHVWSRSDNKILKLWGSGYNVLMWYWHLIAYGVSFSDLSPSKRSLNCVWWEPYWSFIESRPWVGNFDATRLTSQSINCLFRAFFIITLLWLWVDFELLLKIWHSIINKSNWKKNWWCEYFFNCKIGSEGTLKVNQSLSIGANGCTHCGI